MTRRTPWREQAWPTNPNVPKARVRLAWYPEVTGLIRLATDGLPLHAKQHDGYISVNVLWDDSPEATCWVPAYELEVFTED